MPFGMMEALVALAALSDVAGGYSQMKRYRQAQRQAYGEREVYRRQEQRALEDWERRQRYEAEQRERQLGQEREQRARLGALVTQAREPISATPYYQPMTEAERAALDRQIKAELISRGLPPDAAYTSALAAELMAKTETDRYLRSLDYATTQRGDVLRALGHEAGAAVQPPLPGPAAPPVYGLPPSRALFPEGRFGALPQALMFRALTQVLRQPGGPALDAGARRYPIGRGAGEIYTGPRYGWLPAPPSGAGAPPEILPPGEYGWLSPEASAQAGEDLPLPWESYGMPEYFMRGQAGY